MIGLVRHRADHVGGEGAPGGEAQDGVGAAEGVGEGAGVGIHGMRRLPLVHAALAALVDHALGVADGDVGVRQAHGLDQLRTGDSGSPGTVDDQPALVQRAAGDLDRIDEAGGSDDGGAVLVVVEDRDVEQLAQALLDDEAFGRLDVLEVDAAEGGAKEPHAVDELVDVAGVDLEVDRIDVGEALEEDGLAFHHRLGGQRPKVAKAQDGGAVRDHGHEIALGGVVVGGRGVALDGEARHRNAGRIGER